MFEWIKDLLGFGTVEAVADVVEEVTAEVADEPVAACCSAKETRESLNRMTKTDIDMLALERFGVELDRRRTKDVLIAEFLKLQDN